MCSSVTPSRLRGVFDGFAALDRLGGPFESEVCRRVDRLHRGVHQASARSRLAGS
jgi:hypothetical protein